MSNQYLNSITENASRLGMRLQESFSEHTRDLNITRGTGAAYLDGSDDKSKNIRKQLDSNSDREKLDAMKRLIALISKGRNVSEYFAQVVKNVASHNLEIRKLVYIYLLRYAEQEPDLALLSINTFQKDLTDNNPLIRAMALRVLSGIKVPMIGSIVALAIKKCAADVSPYVRKTAALAIPKCFNLDSSHLPALITIISALLRDRSPLSIGSVAVAFEAVCPTRLDLLHQHYRRLCKILVDVDEWGQVDLMNLLLRYVRTMLPRPATTESGSEELDKDIKLLLTSTEPLFQSRNPSVVMAVTRVYYYVAPPSLLHKIVQPLLRLLAMSNEVQRVVLVYISLISKTSPNIFSPFFPRFFVRSDDLLVVKKDKIKLLLNLVNLENYPAIIRELIDYSDDINNEIVSDSISALGNCASLIPESLQQCLTALITMIRSSQDIIVSSAVLVLKSLVQTQLSLPASNIINMTQSPLSIVSHLARKLDDIKHDHARACVIWLVGQYSQSNESSVGPEGIAEWAPDTLRKAAKTFKQEAPLVKLQIITLAAKLFVLSPNDQRIILLSRYVFSLGRYDLNYDVRDRVRMLTSLLAGVAPTTSLMNGTAAEERSGVVLRREQVRLVLFEGKSAVTSNKYEQSEYDNTALGSLRVVTGRTMGMNGTLPDWLEHGVEPSLRDSEDDSGPPVPSAISSEPHQHTRGRVVSPVVLTPTGQSRPSSANGAGATKGAWMDLNKFYESEEEAEEEEESEEEDEPEAKEGEEEELSESEGEGEDDDDDDDESEGEVQREDKDGANSGEEGYMDSTGRANSVW